MSRRFSSSFAGILMSAAASTAPAAELYVNANAAGVEVGTPESPYRTVGAAVAAAVDGDIIRVAAGTYVESVRIEGKAITLQGGFSSAWVRDPATNVTTLAGPGGNAVINLIAADATIDGFRITAGTGSTEELPYGYHGGGIYSRDGSPTLSNNLIEGNDVRTGAPPHAYHFGGGVHISNAPRATIVNNIIRNNYAGRGAGLSVFGQEALIRANTIENNVAVGDHGGGLFLGVVKATVTRNVIRRNEVGRTEGYGWGGGVIVVNPGNFAEFGFNVVTENFAAGYGAGIFIDEGAAALIHHELIYRNVSKADCEAVSAIAVDGGAGNSQATIDHCTVVNNVCENATRGNGLQVEGGSVVTVSNSIFWNNGSDDFAVDGTSVLNVRYTNSQEVIAGTGNISADPLFVSAAADDYRLAAGSPCIDAADPAAPFAAEPADNGGRADMGRYGNAGDATAPGGSAGGGTGGGAGGGMDGGGSSGGSDAGGAGSGPGDRNGLPGGGADAGGSTGGSSDDGAAVGGESVPPAADAALSAAGLCPASAALLFSVSLLGLRRPRRTPR